MSVCICSGSEDNHQSHCPKFEGGDEAWACELVRKIAESTRLGGGYLLYHNHAIREIVGRLKEARSR